MRHTTIILLFIIQAAVADVDTMVQWSRVKMNGKVAMRIGSEKQVSGLGIYLKPTHKQ